MKRFMPPLMATLAVTALSLPAMTVPAAAQDRLDVMNPAGIAAAIGLNAPGLNVTGNTRNRLEAFGAANGLIVSGINVNTAPARLAELPRAIDVSPTLGAGPSASIRPLARPIDLVAGPDLRPVAPVEATHGTHGALSALMAEAADTAPAGANTAVIITPQTGTQIHTSEASPRPTLWQRIFGL